MHIKLATLATATALAFASIIPAKADVVLENKLSGTGDNVVFDSVSGSTAFGSFNGQHQGFVRFTDLSNSSTFTGAANGNDIKISNTANLNITVLGTDKSTQLYTSTDVFSLKGTGDVTAFVTAIDAFGNVEGIKTFDLGVIDPNAQSGFTFTAINGELIQTIRLFDSGGNIADFEHYRVDVAAAPSPVPVPPAVWLFASGLLGMIGLAKKRRRRQQAAALAIA